MATRFAQRARQAPARAPQCGGSDYVARLPSCEESEVREIVWVAAHFAVQLSSTCGGGGGGGGSGAAATTEAQRLPTGWLKVLL